MMTYYKVATEKYNLDIRNLSTFVSSARFEDLSPVSGLLRQERHKVIIMHNATLSKRLKHLEKWKQINEGGT